jgi:nitrate reductase NapAB chaperone NapD
MAIAGLLVHTLREETERIEEKINEMETMTSYGIHNNDFVVVVAEIHSGYMEKEVDKIKAIDGVLTIYTSYVTIEDEN